MTRDRTPATEKPIPLKIAYIGGGSRGWANILMRDLAVCPHLTGVVSLHDIDHEMAEFNADYGSWMQNQPGAVSRWRYEAVADRRAALKGADFVIISIQPGSLEMMAHDIEIPERYGILHTVGDTVGPAGVIRALRTIPTYQDFAEDIAEICPDAWVINYTNPMTVCTRTLHAVAPDIKAFGCCHEVFGTQDYLASLVAEHFGVPRPHRSDIRVNVLGINHFTWIDRATWEGHDLLPLLREYVDKPGIMRQLGEAEVREKNSYFVEFQQVTFELFRRFGLFPCAGDRHLAEFVPWFLKSEDMVHRWGMVRTPVSYRIERFNEVPKEISKRMAGEAPFELKQSSEEGVQQMMALLGLGPMMTNVNIPNEGQISNLPLDAVVETNAWFDRDSVRPMSAGSLPAGVWTLVSRHVANQEMLIRAGLARDKDVAFQVLLNDPLNTASMDDSWKMFNEMLEATREYLPGWNEAGE